MIKNQTKSTGILKIILSDFIIIVIVIIITIIIMMMITVMMMMMMILMIIMLSHSCHIHPLITQGVSQKVNLINNKKPKTYTLKTGFVPFFEQKS